METRNDIISLIEKNRDAIRRFGVRSSVFLARSPEVSRLKKAMLTYLWISKKTFDAYMDLLFFLEDIFGSKVDLVMKDTIKPIIRNRILTETVYVSGL